MTKIQLLSDTHSNKFVIDESIDFAIHAGDITNSGMNQKSSQLQWDKSIRSFKKSSIPVYWVPGNHDIGFKHDYYIDGGVNVLEKTIYYKDISIRGVSLSVAYNNPHIAEYWDHMTASVSEEIKYYDIFLNEYVDIIVSHSPPSGDIASELECGDIGSLSLLHYIKEFQPKLVVCGHVHKPFIREVTIGKTKVVNVAQRSIIIDYENYIGS